MKRRKKTKILEKKVSCRGESGEINCGPMDLKGAARSDQLLVAGLAIIIIVSVGVIGNVLFSWKKHEMGGKRLSRDVNIENLQAQINSLKKQVTKNQLETNKSKADQEELANQAVSVAFENALNDKNFAKIETLMASRVYYVVDASDCCGDITKKEAATNLKKYISGVKSFNFDQNQQVVKQMKVNLVNIFAKYTIGIADNQMVLSYHLNSQGDIDNIMLSSSHLMYDLE